MNEHLYLYKAQVVRVIDGDTIVVNIDLGLKQWSHDVHLRVKDLWCSECRTKDPDEKQKGLAAKDYLISVLTEYPTVFVKTYKMSFSRYMADIWLIDPNHPETFNPSLRVADIMIRAGHGSATRPEE